ELLQHQWPGTDNFIEIEGRHCREIVAIRIVLAAAMDDIGFIQLFTIAIDGAVTQVNAVSRDSDDALHDIKPRLSGRKKDDDVAVVGLTIRQQWPYRIRTRRELHPIAKNVIYDQHIVIDGAGGNLESVR